MLLIGKILRRRAHGPDAERTALILNEHRWSYRELEEAAVRLADGLRALGVARGDRVALLGRNSVEWVVTYFVRARLADFKRPKLVVFTDDLPRTGPIRKIQKAALRERYRELLHAG